MVQLSHLYMTIWKPIALIYTDLCWQSDVSAFWYVCHDLSSKDQESFNFMTVVIIYSDFGDQENKICHCFHFSPSICHDMKGLDAMILVFWMLTFKPAFSLSSFTLIKRLFSSSSLSAIRGVSSAYLSFCFILFLMRYSRNQPLR